MYYTYIYIYISPQFTGIAAPPSNHGCKNTLFVDFFNSTMIPSSAPWGMVFPLITDLS